ncbi:hypothetical protein L484_016192 [Morus notabilis]|uniref:Uncharacterized protein n=1 Tax=Morus notabilis TaxID=981085 RepID=W9RHK8_9ROSA|nr:hypothetical protein L484_016192 [Morus notabilis]
MGRVNSLVLETIPIVARHRESMSFSTPEGSRLFTLLQPIQIPNRISWREVQKLSSLFPGKISCSLFFKG